MDVTDAKGLWRLTKGMVENRRTGKVRIISNMPTNHKVAMMHEETFVRKCGEAFLAGEWPV